jgi:HEAT repeat protein
LGKINIDISDVLRDAKISQALQEIKHVRSWDEFDKAARPLRSMGRAALPPVLERTKRSHDEGTRHAALLTLNKLMEELSWAPPNTAAALLAIAKDKTEQRKLRVEAINGLRTLQLDWTKEMRFLVSAINDKAISDQALWVLWEMGPAAAPTVPRLIEEVKKGKDADAMRMPISVLGRIGPVAKDAIPVILETLRHDDARLRVTAAGALGDVGPQTPEVIPALARALQDKDDSVRQEAAAVLRDIGPAARAALPALFRALQDKEAKVRQRALEAILMIVLREEQFLQVFPKW